MAYVNVAEWKPDQVTDWLKGLDNAILPYLQLFLNNDVNGQQLLNVRSEDLENLGIKRLGHQELILEAVEHLRNFHYELDRENLQLLALRLSCQAHSLHNELLRHTDSQPVSTQTLADVASVVRSVKPLVCWLDRSPFSGQLEYADRKTDLLKYSLEIATCAQRDRFAERPVEEIRSSCGKLAAIADGIIQDIADPLILQPASLDLATLRKRGGDDLGFYIVPSFYGVHQIGEIKFGSPAHQCGKVEEGDEVVQVNYQTVVGWQRKKVMGLLEESLTDVFLTLKKRPRHTKVYGQIYMKPYRLPSKKRAPAYTRWHDNLPSPRPELLTIPDFEIPVPRVLPKSPPSKHVKLEPLSNTILSASSESDDGGSGCDEASLDYELEGHASPTSMRLYLPKPRAPVQRRATITGASPTSHLPPADIEKFWRELKLEKKWKCNGKTPQTHNSNPECRALRNKSPCEQNERPSTCLGFEKSSSKDFIKQVDYVGKLDSFSKQNVESKSHQVPQDLNSNRRESSNGSTSDPLSPSAIILPTTNNTQNLRVEKRFITRLELMVDPLDSHIQFTEVKVSSKDVKESHPIASSNFYIEDNMSKSNEKARKISTESQVGDLPVHRERGRLDKSFSTPAYDLSGLDCLEMKLSSSKIEMDSVSKTPSDEPFLRQFKMPDVASSATSSMSKDHFSSDNVFQFPTVNRPKSCSTDSETTKNYCAYSLELSDCDVNYNPVIHGRVVETINRHLLDSNCGKDGDEDNDMLVPDNHPANQVKANIVNNIVFSSPDLITDIPSPRFNHKLVEDLDNENHFSTAWCSDHDNSKSSFDCNFNSNATTPPYQEANQLKPSFSVTETHCRDDETIHLSKSLDVPSLKVFSCDSKKPPPTPPARYHMSSELSDQMQPPMQQSNMPSKISVIPPDPPPRPNPPNRSPSVPSPSVQSLIRTKLSSKVGTPKTTFGSPKVLRKRNPFLAKRRSVGVKELGIADYQGWLYRRLRIGDSGAQWIKGWFILKGTTFYGFKSREAHKADCFISLPGFTTSPAEEVKSRKFAFKVYHTGTVFYFAAESDEELAAWLDCLSMATFALDVTTLKSSAAEGAVFSETEDEGDDEAEVADSCFPSPKMRKFTNFLSGHSHVTTAGGSPKAAHSQQNLVASTESKSYDIQKRFGSLKKLGYRSKAAHQLSSQSSSSATSLSSSEQSQDILSAPHSLDRKVLRFLSSSKSQNVPVPTSQFKSYRRVMATEPCSTYSKHSEGVPSSKGDDALLDLAAGSYTVQNYVNPLGDHNARRNNRGIDSRGGETAGTVTLEQFMLQRQEEERQQNYSSHSHRDRSRERDHDRDAATSNRDTSEAYTGYTEDPVLSRHKSLEKRRSPPAAPRLTPQRPIPAIRTIIPSTQYRDAACDPPVIVPRSNKSSTSSDSIDPRVGGSNCSKQSPEQFAEVIYSGPSAPRQLHLKNAAMYQPPPVTFTPNPNFGPSFEMHLDQHGILENSTDESWGGSHFKGTSSKIRQFLSPKRAYQLNPQGQFSSPNHQEISAPTPHRSIVGSPRLHRALFRQTDNAKKKSATLSNPNIVGSPSTFGLTLASATSSPMSSADWASTPSLSLKPTMGVPMINKKPGSTLTALSNINNLSSLSPPLSPPQTPLSPPPDYPGLEYPPVFEPGIYSLSDSNTFLGQSSSLYSPSSSNSSPQNQ